MRLTAPGFWYAQPGVAAWILAPVGALYAVGGRLRRWRAEPASLPVPLICIGNLVAGGSGKTPIAMDIAARLLASGQQAALLSRGYGGRLPGPIRVDPGRHTAGQVGDEPLLHAGVAPAWIARDRAAGARACARAGASVVVMDDGFQNPTVRPDLSLVAIDGTRGFGNGRVIPAGPLREPVADGLARAHAAVLVDGDGPFPIDRLPHTVLRARLVADESIDCLRGQPVIAFAGVARPSGFFAMLRQAGVEILAAQGFPDHHRFRPGELEILQAEAHRAGAALVTTEKDWVRLPQPLRQQIRVVRRRVVWSDVDALDRLINRTLAEPTETI